jgi:Flp pilus assembly pilin Flp
LSDSLHSVFTPFWSFQRTLVRLRKRTIVRDNKQIWQDERGAVAVEFALVATILVFLLLNGLDLGRYLYLRTELENATQAGAHAVWKTCDPTKLPIDKNCNPAAKTAVKEVVSSFVSNVADGDVTLTEGYFCTDAGGSLHSVQIPATPPLALPPACQAGIAPGDYVIVNITYAYEPLFGNVTVFAKLFGSSISTTSFMRMQ